MLQKLLSVFSIMLFTQFFTLTANARQDQEKHDTLQSVSVGINGGYSLLRGTGDVNSGASFGVDAGFGFSDLFSVRAAFLTTGGTFESAPNTLTATKTLERQRLYIFTMAPTVSASHSIVTAFVGLPIGVAGVSKHTELNSQLTNTTSNATDVTDNRFVIGFLAGIEFELAHRVSFVVQGSHMNLLKTSSGGSIALLTATGGLSYKF